MKTIKLYLSHPIRGDNSQKMSENNKAAIVGANFLRTFFKAIMLKENLPLIELYVPAEHEEFIWLAYQKQFLTLEQILAVDCEILRNTDALLYWSRTKSNGMKVEKKFAQENKIPIFIIKEKFISSSTLLRLKKFIKFLIK